jgi:hypothetical protein
MWQGGQNQPIFLLRQGLTTEDMMVGLMPLSQSLTQTFLNESKIKAPWEAFVPPF